MCWMLTFASQNNWKAFLKFFFVSLWNLHFITSMFMSLHCSSSLPLLEHFCISWHIITSLIYKIVWILCFNYTITYVGVHLKEARPPFCLISVQSTARSLFFVFTIQMKVPDTLSLSLSLSHSLSLSLSLSLSNTHKHTLLRSYFAQYCSYITHGTEWTHCQRSMSNDVAIVDCQSIISWGYDQSHKG